MTQLLERIAARDGVVSRLADRLASRVLPEQVTASGSCYWRCVGPACNSYQGWWGTRQLEYCTAGYWTGRSRCWHSC
jgi:hypothetical protein